MTSREVMSAVLDELGRSQASAAKAIGWHPNQLSQRMLRSSLRSDEMFRIFDAIGIDVTFSRRDTGKVIKIPDRRKGHGRRVKGMSDGVIYDTASASAISNSFYEDGVNEYGESGEAQELYRDDEGRYFIAEYHRDDESRDRVRSLPANIAIAFKEKYGEQIEKAPPAE